ncbi:Large cysteine-rich periplasmic protein omcB [Planctomycetes bacterium LzC2]|uniref:Large cysteine-rich periplasmic protein omcB n=2 Tax=Alienimonas chondri TaxID=2681879 RepID=A0ABX1VLB9_9PLAN|nr:Large cysteine-rich periplasmic protein omcB [Alienimonas chondri]
MPESDEPVPAPAAPAVSAPIVSTIGVDGGIGPQTAGLSVTWQHAGPIRVGRVCSSTLTVKNAGPATAYGVTVTGDVSANMGLAAADPTPEGGVDTPNPTWTFPALAAGEVKSIRLTYTPTAVGSDEAPEYANRLAAMVTSRLIARGAPLVTEPKLAVELEGVREALLGEPATQTILVSNPGTGSIDEALIEVLLPEGLDHSGGPKRLTMNIGALSAGETKPVRLGLMTSAGGVQTVSVRVRGEGGLEAETEADVQVKSPQIDLEIDGPGLRYVNRITAMKLTVTNPGDAATDNVRLGYRVPDGFEFLSTDTSGTHDPSGNTVRWFLGRIEAGASVTATVNLKAVTGGEQVHMAEVSASSRAKASARHVTRIEGTASLVLKIQDSDDPVEVGAETEYTVTVSNEGTAAAKTVGLACRVPDGTETGVIRGPAAHRTEGSLILFDSLPELAPGAKKVYTLRIKGTTPGSKRFQTRLVSESISEPLIHEEITKFYAE